MAPRRRERTRVIAANASLAMHHDRVTEDALGVYEGKKSMELLGRRRGSVGKGQKQESKTR